MSIAIARKQAAHGAAEPTRRRGPCVLQLVDPLRRLGLRQIRRRLLVRLSGERREVRPLRAGHPLVARRPVVRVLEGVGLVRHAPRIPDGRVEHAFVCRRWRAAAGAARAPVAWRHEPRTLAGLQAAGRLAIGASLAAAPRLLAGGWVGGAADRRPGQVLAIGLGARDVALALGTLQALGARRGATAWLRAGIVADLADLVATLRARDELAAARRTGHRGDRRRLGPARCLPAGRARLAPPDDPVP